MPGYVILKLSMGCALNNIQSSQFITGIDVGYMLILKKTIYKNVKDSIRHVKAYCIIMCVKIYL